MPQICPIHLCSSCVFSEIQLHALLNLCSCFCRSSLSGPECAALRFQNVCCLPRIIDLSRNILEECFIPRSIFFGQRNDRVNRAVYRKLRCKIGVVCVSGFHCRSDFTFKCGCRHRKREAPEHRLAGVRKQELQKCRRAVCVIGIFEDRDLCIRAYLCAVRLGQPIHASGSPTV